VFISKLIDGRFPDYEKVIPNNLSRHLNLNRKSLIEILSRAAILSNEKFRGVSIMLENGVLRVSSHNPDQEEAMDEMAVEYDGDPVEIGFNVGYLLEALRVLTSEVVDFGLQDSNTSCTVTELDDEDTLYLIMPMRL
jgi:DNA polymerase-3 subunit beta